MDSTPFEETHLKDLLSGTNFVQPDDVSNVCPNPTFGITLKSVTLEDGTALDIADFHTDTVTF